ncbi:MAG: tyrosine-type recombinase/integrase, partial [Oscillospiraceae bacterium]|nr:tyrosine-type recombinase/integrase [Oscillospiraceae bacterium]
MATRKEIKIHNKSDKPDNVVMKENEIIRQCQEAEKELPGFLRGFFAYLKSNVLPMTRLAYLQDIRFFCNYLIKESHITNAKETKEIPLSDFNQMKAMDINAFLDYCRRYETETDKAIYIYENHNKSLARKKSSISVLFKYLYRDELIDKNITDGFDPIRLPKAGEREIKALQDNEVMVMLDAVSTGDGLTKKEKEFWEKTKKRDKAILILFLTYGLRLSELQQLNVSSFHFQRGEFKIYRKRGKESTMPLNQSVIKVVTEYLDAERASDDTLDPKHQDALFLSLQGSRMTERQIRELAKKYTSIGLATSRDS